MSEEVTASNHQFAEVEFVGGSWDGTKVTWRGEIPHQVILMRLGSECRIEFNDEGGWRVFQGSETLETYELRYPDLPNGGADMPEFEVEQALAELVPVYEYNPQHASH
ncbi:MAG: hypothetical protein MJA29_11635 [Candidatus Omnitrophica bacterium]|nr:hypothetical protein [Candidatus Omnitrophota bacterium]